ncbi:MAG: NifU N-terminal domain-containing protein [Longimicrobiales bacterium]
MADITVRFQPTPNPNAGKFTVNRAVVEGPASKSFYSADQAVGEPVAAALFSIDGVAGLFMVADFITVTKVANAAWDRLVPEVISVIEQSMA